MLCEQVLESLMSLIQPEKKSKQLILNGMKHLKESIRKIQIKAQKLG